MNQTKIQMVLVIISVVFIIFAIALGIESAILLDRMHQFTVELETKTQKMEADWQQSLEIEREIRLEQKSNLETKQDE